MNSFFLSFEKMHSSIFTIFGWLGIRIPLRSTLFYNGLVRLKSSDFLTIKFEVVLAGMGHEAAKIGSIVVQDKVSIFNGFW
jgi:hypothetical protein